MKKLLLFLFCIGMAIGQVTTGGAGGPGGVAAAGSPITAGEGAVASAAWTSATAGNTTLAVSTVGFSNVTVSFIGGSITGGVITFEVSQDGATWVPIAMTGTAGPGFVSTYTLTGVNNIWQMYVAGIPNFRVRLSTAITGAGTANITIKPTAIGTEFPNQYITSLANMPTARTLTGRPSNGAQLIEKTSHWSVVSMPAAGTAASASIAAEAGVQHVVDCISFAGTATGAVTGAGTWAFNLRDGAAGAGTIIWQFTAGTPIGTLAAGDAVFAFHSICGLNLVGTVGTAMTFEFSTAVTNVVTSVSISGYNVN